MQSLSAAILEGAASYSARREIWEKSNTAEVEIPKERLDNYVSYIIVTVTQSVATNDAGSRVKQVGHFRLFLVLDQKQESIELNSFGSRGLYTRLGIYHRPYTHSDTNNSMGFKSFKVSEPFKVRQALQVLFENGRDRYMLNPESGSGCKYWCIVALSDFARNGWVSVNNAQMPNVLADEVRPVYTDTYIPTNLIQGTFY